MSAAQFNRLTAFIAVLIGTALVHGQAKPSDPPTESAVPWKAVLTKSSSLQVGAAKTVTIDEQTFARFAVRSVQGLQQLSFEFPLPVSLVHDELTCRADVSSSKQHAQLALRITLPNQPDPRTGKPLVALLTGDVSKTEDETVLKVSTTAKDMGRLVRNLRAMTQQESIDTTGAYVDACVVMAEVHNGTSFFDLGQPEFGPVVSPLDAPTKTMQDVPDRIVELDRDRLMIRGEPAFLKFAPDHGEPVSRFVQLGVDAVWMAELQDKERLAALRDAGLIVIATPPHPEFDPADFSAPVQGLPPLETIAPEPDMWYLGTGVQADAMPHLLAWAREVRSADRQMRRLIMADVRAAEGVASRQVDFVGISSNMLGSLKPFRELRNEAYLRKNKSAQLILPWQWIQTQPNASLTAWCERLGLTPPHMEPEQILWQTMAALSAGSRGIGFWKTEAIGDDTLSEETALAIELASQYVDLLEPLLISGRIEGHVLLPEGNRAGDSRLNSMLGGREIQPADYIGPTRPDAALVDASPSTLLIATAWDDTSHFVPHPGELKNVQLTVATAETAAPCRISVTGLQGMRREPTAGGLSLNFPEFDQFEIALVTPDPGVRQQIQQRIHLTAQRAATIYVRLAELKLLRVTTTLQQFGSGPAGSSLGTLLSQADEAHAMAERSLDQNNLPNAERYARRSLRLLRQAQQQVWSVAFAEFGHPTATPFTTNFSTVAGYNLFRSQQNQVARNVLPSGNFENLKLLSESGWTPFTARPDEFNTGAAIVDELGGRNQAMRLRAWPKNGDTVASSKPPLLMSSPVIGVRKGDVLTIEGRIRFGQAIDSESDAPLMIFDSDLGPESALKPKLNHTWKPFRMMRVASQDGAFKIWFGLETTSEVFIDDLTVRQSSSTPSGPIQPVSNTVQPQ